jgi:cell division septum initiation protein DivIVA
VFRLLLKYSLKLLPLVLHEIADFIKEKQKEKQETKDLTAKIQENENSK